MTLPSRLPRVIRMVLGFCVLGDARDDVEADLAELFALRRAEMGRLRATWWLLADLASVARRRRDFVRRPGPTLRRGGAGAWRHDLRCGVRLFRKHPAVIGATAAGLALAIAVCTAVFTILNAAVLRPYRMDDPTSVVRVRMIVNRGWSTTWPYDAFLQLQDRARLSRVEAYLSDAARLSVAPDSAAERKVDLLLVSGGYLPLLGGRAVLGRTLQPSDDAPGAVPVVVLNHAFWSKSLNADPNIVGTTIWLSGNAVTVAGVIGHSFSGPVDKPPAIWAPFGSYAAIYRDRPLDRHSRVAVHLVARTSPGVARRVAEEELSAVAAALPDTGVRIASGALEPVTAVRFDGAASPIDGPEAGEVALLVGVILLIVGLVLALACANVANLLLAGAASRAREIAIRLAIGASPGRIVRQLLTESVLIGAAAGAMGLVLSVGMVPIVTRVIGLPDTYDVSPDRAVIGFAVVMALVSGVGAGLAPARYGARGDVAVALKSDGAPSGTPRHATRLRRWFIGVQAAASIVLLVTAALFARAALHITHVDLGFDAERLAAIAPGFGREYSAAEVPVYFQRALERVRAIRSVDNASLALYPPFGGAVAVTNLNRNGSTYQIFENRTDDRYFATAGLRIVRGRPYSAADVSANAPVAVVSEAVVRDFLDGRDPIGASLGLVSSELSSVTIVGVVRDAVTARVRSRGHGTIYRPLDPRSAAAARLVVRSERPRAIVRDLQDAFVSVDARVRPKVSIVSDDVERYLNEPRVLAGLSGSLAALALVLAVLGLYGVTSFVVGERTREMSIRRAIGAPVGAIVRLVVRQSLTPVTIGLAIGLVIALAGTPVLAPALSGISPYDPAAIAASVLVLLAAALAAAIAPALRAAGGDPVRVMRS